MEKEDVLAYERIAKNINIEKIRYNQVRFLPTSPLDLRFRMCYCNNLNDTTNIYFLDYGEESFEVVHISLFKDVYFIRLQKDASIYNDLLNPITSLNISKPNIYLGDTIYGSFKLKLDTTINTIKFSEKINRNFRCVVVGKTAIF